METYTLSRSWRPIRRSSSLAVAMLAAAALGGGYAADFSRPANAPRETDEERDARKAREARHSAEAIAAAQARREKREARRQSDRERTARQQGRTLQANAGCVPRPENAPTPKPKTLESL